MNSPEEILLSYINSHPGGVTLYYLETALNFEQFKHTVNPYRPGDRLDEVRTLLRPLKEAGLITIDDYEPEFVLPVESKDEQL